MTFRNTQCLVQFMFVFSFCSEFKKWVQIKTVYNNWVNDKPYSILLHEWSADAELELLWMFDDWLLNTLI